jgi:hypothetical protein
MHTVHFIAVEADTEEEAIEAAHFALEPYGDGDVWDWHEVGGRWHGILGGKDVLCYSDNPELWEKTLGAVYDRMDRTFTDLRDRMTGKRLGVDDVEDRDNVFGLPIDDKPAYVERNNKVNRQYADAFNRVLEWDAVPRTMDEVGEENMALWTMEQLCKIASGRYTFDTPFLDGVDGGVWRGGVDARCEEDPAKQWLVAFDLHN